MAGLQFGFSLDPQDAPQRHCFYDSEEEEELENSVPEDVFSVELVDKLAIKLLIIGNTQAASSFLSSHVITESEPCAVVKTRYPLKVIKGKYFTRDGEQAVSNDTTVSKIYRDVKNGGTCLCLNERIFKEEYCNYWSKTIIDHLKPQCVVFLHSLPLHCYLSSESNSDDSYNYQLKGLTTCWWSLDPLTDQFLGPSNVLSGEPAAVMTHCQVSCLPAAMAVLYVSNALTPKEQVECFRPLLSHPLLSSSLTVQTFADANRLLMAIIPKPRQDLNTLYT